MSVEQVDAILKALRQRMSDEENDATFYAMRDAMKTIRAWQTAGGDGEIPYADELQEWGLFTADEGHQPPPPATETMEEATAVLESLKLQETPESDELEEADGLPDPDEPLQSAYDEAVALLHNARYAAARDAFAGLRLEASGRLQADIAGRYEEAEAKLAEQVRTRIEKAENHTEKQPRDYKGQRQLWEKVREIEPENDTAQTALQRLDEQEIGQKTTQSIERLHEGATAALQTLRLTELNRWLGEAESLQQNNTVPDLQPALDDLVQHISRQRDQLRSQLGSASTLLVSGNQREAYRQAQEYLDRGVAVVFDQAGILDKAGGEVESYLFYQKAREMFIASLRDLAQQRLTLAEAQKGQNPELALKTLQDTQQRLRDDILSKEDRDELEPTLKPVEQLIEEVEGRLQRFEGARAKVLEAQQAAQPAAEQYRLFREARELYPDYPNIEQYIERVQDDLAAQAAGELQDQIVMARRRKEQDDFDGAVVILQAARRQLLSNIPQPKPDSELSQRLQDVARLEDEIALAERDYKNMLATLAEVDELLNQHEQEKAAGALVAARTRLEQLGEQESNHPETQRRRTWLIQLQGVGESWEQGLAAYHLGEWDNAIQLLSRVTSSDAPEKNEAVRLVSRARAVKYTLEAGQAESEQRWRDALTRYRAADGLFQSFMESDNYTERFQREAKTALERLKPLETNDAAVQNALQIAQSLLASASLRVKARVSPGEKVEPVADFLEAVKVLLGVRSLQSNLTQDVETTLSQARKAWQDAYRQGMRIASQSDDVIILDKAVQLGQSLKEHDLLYTTEDKQLWRGIQERFLDVELAQLQRDPATDPERIETNRRRRLDIALTPTDELTWQYREAMEQRVRFQLGEERQKGIGAAVIYLKKELSRPELYENLGLFEELMHLLWETGDWEEARMRAEGLAYRRLAQARPLSEQWLGFTMAARRLDAGNLEQFRAEMNHLLQVAQQDPEHLALWQRQQEWLVEWRVERLVDLATADQTTPQEEAVITAAQIYAQAHRLKPQDSRVQTGLREIGRQLQPILAAQCQQALTITMRQSLAQSLDQANRLKALLADILGIADPLGLNQEMKEGVRNALDHLERKIKPWAQIQAQLDLIEKEKTAALNDPVPFQGQSEGGWQLQVINEKLNETQRLVDSSDREMMRLLRDKREEFSQLITKADGLNSEVLSLHKALEDEDFAEVMAATGRLEKLWPQRQVEGFNGLESLVRYNDPFQRKDVRHLGEHRKRAQEQQSDLEQWRNWVEQVGNVYNQARKATTPMKKPLAMLVQEKALREVAADCRQVLKLCEDFQEALDARPGVGPLSQRAATEKSRVNGTWEGEVLDKSGGYRGISTTLLDQIDAAVKELQGPLNRLRSAMQQLERVATPTSGRLGRTREPDPALVRRWLSQARPRLQECRQIDPLHSEVFKFGQRIRELEDKYEDGGG